MCATLCYLGARNQLYQRKANSSQIATKLQWGVPKQTSSETASNGWKV